MPARHLLHRLSRLFSRILLLAGYGAPMIVPFSPTSMYSFLKGLLNSLVIMGSVTAYAARFGETLWLVKLAWLPNKPTG